MNIQWPQDGAIIQLTGGKNGRYLGKCPLIGKHRVQTFKHDGRDIDPPTDSTQQCVYTTWLLSDDGICRCDGKPGEHDFARALERLPA